MISIWTWSSDPEPLAAVEIGGGVRLPTYASGSAAHSWWAMVVLLLSASALYLAFLFSYLYLWTVSPQVWPSSEAPAIQSFFRPVISGALLLLGGLALVLASRRLSGRNESSASFAAFVFVAAVAISSSLALELMTQWQTGIRPEASGYGAMVYLNILLQLQFVSVFIVMSGFVLARRYSGRLDAVRRVTFDNLALFGYYTVCQGLLGLLLIHGFPRLVAG
jgi:cytochrome c oxidase subunit I+III